MESELSESATGMSHWTAPWRVLRVNGMRTCGCVSAEQLSDKSDPGNKSCARFRQASNDSAALRTRIRYAGVELQ